MKHKLSSNLYKYFRCNIIMSKSNSDPKLKNLSQTIWLKNLKHHPKNFSQMKLFIEIIDKIGICTHSQFDINLIPLMDPERLDIIYATLMIMNTSFNKFVDNTVKKIFIENIEEMFECNDLRRFDLFFDQLTQDIDYFVCTIIKSFYPIKINYREEIENKFIDYLKLTFSKKFYKLTTKKLSYEIDDEFFIINKLLFSRIIDEFVLSIESILGEIYSTIKMFLDQVFNPDCSLDVIKIILNSLEKHINVDILLNSQTMDIQMYMEQKLYIEQNKPVSKYLSQNY